MDGLVHTSQPSRLSILNRVEFGTDAECQTVHAHLLRWPLREQHAALRVDGSGTSRKLHPGGFVALPCHMSQWKRFSFAGGANASGVKDSSSLLCQRHRFYVLEQLWIHKSDSVPYRELDAPSGPRSAA